MSTPWPDLPALALLVGVDDNGSLSAAARALGMAQPNASRAIAALERDLHVALVERHPRGSRLTRIGRQLVDSARALLDEAERFRIQAAALTGLERTRLDIAASLTVAERLVPEWLAQLRRATPGIDVHLQVHNSRRVFDLVASGGCALGFVETPRVPPNLRSVPVSADELILVVAPRHPWSRRRRPIAPDELAATPLIVREQGSGTRATLDVALGDYGPACPALETGSNAAALASVASGSDPAVLSRLAVADWIDRGDLVAVPVEGLDLRRSIRAVWRTDPLPETARTLIEIAASTRMSAR